MDRLIVICEGGVHTVEYLQRNGVFPAAMVLEPKKFQDMSPYLTKDDDILLIISGLTDFTMSDIYNLLSKFKEYENRFKRVTILTNIPLGVIPYDYYLYSGDLFYGSVIKVSNNKKYELDSNGNVDTQKKSFFSKKSDVVVENKNPITFQFKKYNDRKVKLMIYGKRDKEIVETISHYEYEDKIKVVDLFSKEN
jgi:hypothetical protein